MKFVVDVLHQWASKAGSSHEVIFLDSIGKALQDVTTATMIYQNTVEHVSDRSGICGVTVTTISRRITFPEGG